MTDVDVSLTTGTVTVNLGTEGAIGGATTLTTLKRMTSVSAVGNIGMSNIAEGTISGVLTVTKAGTTAREVTFPDAAITVARSDAAQTFIGTQTVQAAATQDAVALAGRAGGTGSYVATITPPTLSASITLTLPAVTGTLAVLGTNTFTGNQTLSDVDVVLGTTTGTKIGTAVTQKLGFWNVTPVVQPAAAGQAAAAAITQDALTDNSGGSASTTLAAISDTPTKNAVASLAAQLAKVKADIAARDTLLTAIRTALVNTGIIKGAA